MQQSAVLSETKRRLLETYRRGFLPGRGLVASTIGRRPSGASAPLSLGQEQIWLRAESASILPAAFNESVTIHRHGPLDVAILQRCLSEIIQRHEAWRTTFNTVDGQPVQIIHPASLCTLRVVDLREIPEADREAEALRLATEQAQQPFDLRQGPLVRALLVMIEDQRHRLHLTMHQSIVDGVSVYRVFPEELILLYQAFLEGRPSPLLRLAIQYADFAWWERRCLQPDVRAKQLSYWRKQLGGELPLLAWPADRTRPPVKTFRGAIRPFWLPDDLRAQLKNLCRREGATLFMVLLAGFAALLHRYTQQEDIVIGTVASPGRKYPELQQLLGYFLNPIALRINVSGKLSFRELLAQVRGVVSEGLSHDDVPLECVVENLKLRPDPARHPLFQVVISLAPPMADLPPGWSQSFMDVESGGAKWDLYLELSDRPPGILGRGQYNPDLFEPDTITRMLGHWETLLRAVAGNPQQPIGSAPLLTEFENNQLLVEWNDTRTDYPRDVPVHEMIEAQVERTPNAVAVVYESRQMSYRLLDARANQLGHYLRKMGACPEALVGICLRRSPDLITALLGVMKSGAAYVPLDPDYPAGRLAFMAADSGMKVLVTQRALLAKFSEYRGKLVCLDREREVIGRESIESVSAGARGNDLIYVIYTSGSTGKPKGVEIRHRSLLNFLLSMQSNPGFTALDTILAVTTVSFDIAALELYLPLISGGRVALASRETAIDGDRLRDALTTMAPTVMQATPATWRLLLEAGWLGSRELKILCGGEAMPPELARELVKRGASLWNMYGPTETTVWSAVAQITSADAPITVGRPIANTQTYVLDSKLQPVPAGIPGELYIGGDGVARGYLGRPELTAEKFIPDPFSEPASGACLYRTGDLALYRPNGEIECLGRTDHQVKVRGFRIELGEIESVLAGHPSVRQNVVWTQEDESGEKQLVAYIVAAHGPSPSVKELRDFLKHKLPEYMVPSQFVFLETLPLTPNGKVDRRALPLPSSEEMAGQSHHTAPAGDPIERQLADIWRKVLRVGPIGVEDNFFDLGGHSLLVGKLVRHLEQVFGTELSIAAILQAPTITQQAALLRDSARARHAPTVIPMQPGGSKVPFFLVGARPLFRPLASRLGPDRPFVALHLELSRIDGLSVPYRLEEIATHFVRILKQYQPTGPYYLGGYCFDGLVAYEMARQLISQHSSVGLLVLFEAENPAVNEKLSADAVAKRLAHHIEKLRALEPRKVAAYVLGRLSTGVHRAGFTLSKISYGTRAQLGWGRLRNSRQILNVAAASYRPSPYDGRAVLFRSTDRSLDFSRDPYSGWRNLIRGGFEVHEIPGDHISMFLEPEVVTLASKVDSCLSTAQLEPQDRLVPPVSSAAQILDEAREAHVSS